MRGTLRGRIRREYVSSNQEDGIALLRANCPHAEMYRAAINGKRSDSISRGRSPKWWTKVRVTDTRSHVEPVKRPWLDARLNLGKDLADVLAERGGDGLLLGEDRAVPVQLGERKNLLAKPLQRG